MYATALIMTFAIASCEEETPKSHMEDAKENMKEAGEDMKEAGKKAGDNIKAKTNEVKEDIKDDHPN